MNKRFLFTLISFVIIISCSMSAAAFSATKYTNLSKLASGKWVKIAIPEDGMYQITYEELKQMGFSNPEDVRIFGYGGHPLSEVLNGNAYDDLIQIPHKNNDEKIYFYGCGPVNFSITTPSTTPQFTRDINSYSTVGYYFITSDPRIPYKEPNNITYQANGTKVRSTSLDYFYHEQEIMSPSQSGKEMLGEQLTDDGVNIPYSIFGLCADSAMVINPFVAAKSTNNTYVTAEINGDAVDLSIGSTKIYGTTSQYVFYNSAFPSGIYRNNSGIPSNGYVKVNLTAAVTWSRLNYCILSFYHHNNIGGSTDNQLRMGFNNVSSADIISLVNPTSTTQLWNIDNPQEPKNYNITSFGDNMKGFTPVNAIDYTQFIAFDPNKPLKSIAGFEDVENQNIHGLSTPDMIIITCEELMPQAERIAQMHRDNDNMDVHVIDQQKIFNEFSSGTPDAMAIRLMNKMFYDRDYKKFKHLLMFGAGNYDNRQLFSKRDCTILAYESNISNDENNSYVCDDFFGMLEDNSGANIAGDMLKLGVGRIPCVSIEEAESDVDKLLHYINNPDYGPWRNNALFVADYVYSDPDEKYLHEMQAEGISNIINDELNIGLMKNRVYVTQFPKDPNTGFWLEGRRSMNTQLNAGQFFMTYVGHANPTTLTKEAYLWTANEAKNATNPHLPIVTTACCDVARYDGSQRGLMETMFHKPDGGLIAMVGATRSAYSNGNDALNQAFARSLFCYNTKGYMPTLGEAYMLCKNYFGTIANYNKMMFSLFGDPAMKVNYPKPYFKITKINGRTVSTSSISSGALQQVTVEAKVYTPDGNAVDYSFNGNATLSIYDYQKKETTYNNRDIFHPRKLLTQVSGRVVNGVFTCQAVIPRYTLYPGTTGLVSVYAHRDNSDDMVNGSFDKLVLAKYNPDNALTINDNTPPYIDAIYFNNEQEFDAYNQVGTASTLYIRATDDYSFNTQTIAIGNGMSLKIHGGKISLPDVVAFSSMSDGGKTLEVNMPITLQPGEHTLEYTVSDAAGNVATKTVLFAVGTQQLELTVDEEPAVDMATFNISTHLETEPTVDIKVFDHNGSLKWHTSTTSFPLNWNLVGDNGKKLAPGVYTFHGKYNNGTAYGGTTTGTLVVASQVKTE